MLVDSVRVARTSNYIRMALFALLGAGVAGNTVNSRISNQNQTKMTRELQKELDESQLTIQDLNERLLHGEGKIHNTSTLTKSLDQRYKEAQTTHTKKVSELELALNNERARIESLVKVLNTEQTASMDLKLKLTEELANRTKKAEELEVALKTEQEKIEELNKAFVEEKENTKKLTSEVQEGKVTLLGMLNRINDLNKKLNTKVTLDQIAEAVEIVAPSTVKVEGESEMQNPFTGEKRRSPVSGSGVIITDTNNEKYILTNAHVVEGSELADGTFLITLYNGSETEKPAEFHAQVVTLESGGRALSAKEEYDLALLKIPADVKLPENTGIQLRDISSEPLKPGEPVIALGSPLGLRDSVSFGVISHTDRSVGINHDKHIQTDAAINPGNSGSGLFDMQGRLIGINELVRGDGQSIGLSIRIDFVKNLLEKWGIKVMTKYKEKSF